MSGKAAEAADDGAPAADVLPGQGVEARVEDVTSVLASSKSSRKRLMRRQGRCHKDAMREEVRVFQKRGHADEVGQLVVAVEKQDVFGDVDEEFGIDHAARDVHEIVSTRKAAEAARFRLGVEPSRGVPGIADRPYTCHCNGVVKRSEQQLQTPDERIDDVVGLQCG